MMLYSRHYAVTTLIKLPLLPLQRLHSNLALPADVAQQPLRQKLPILSLQRLPQQPLNIKVPLHFNVYPLTDPIVSPEMMYLWKNGYANAIGTTISTTSAIRRLSAGREFMILEASAPIMELFFTRKSTLVCICIRSYCSGM